VVAPNSGGDGVRPMLGGEEVGDLARGRGREGSMRGIRSPTILRADGHVKSHEPRREYSEGDCEFDILRVYWNHVLLFFFHFLAMENNLKELLQFP
jgi:hypothetical protein